MFHISQPGLPHSCLKCFICSPYMLRQSTSGAPTLTRSTLPLAPPLTDSTPHWPPPSHWLHPLIDPTLHWPHPSVAPPSYGPHPVTGATLSASPSLWSLTSFQALSQRWCVFISGAFLHLPVTAMESPPTHRLLGRTAGACKAGGSASTETVLGEPVASWDVAYSLVERKAGANL